VFSPGPISTDSPVLKMPNVILSAHVAAASLASATRLREAAARTALLAVQGKPLPNVVNGVDF
jgi:glyoxylate reductase